MRNIEKTDNQFAKSAIDAYKIGLEDGQTLAKVTMVGEKKAMWIVKEDGDGLCGRFSYHCTNCGKLQRNSRYRYCPHCGARMLNNSWD